ncbi:hypothetical protein [Telluria beijingensis]|uniref:hypothetical protein n=1 Tax=Telluria beijingensis TaxID=3068633 RepID=UPI0027959430|nr:hypothetical protein [Massilia sp. REN29]
MPIRRLPPGAEYDPNRVLDAIISRLRLKNDAALSRLLEVAPPVISKIRHSTLPIGATLLIRMHEESDFSIGELRALMIRKGSEVAHDGAK